MFACTNFYYQIYLERKCVVGNNAAENGLKLAQICKNCLYLAVDKPIDKRNKHSFSSESCDAVRARFSSLAYYLSSFVAMELGR
jgi:hypothetical protein